MLARLFKEDLRDSPRSPKCRLLLSFFFSLVAIPLKPQYGVPTCAIPPMDDKPRSTLPDRNRHLLHQPLMSTAACLNASGLACAAASLQCRASLHSCNKEGVQKQELDCSEMVKLRSRKKWSKDELRFGDSECNGELRGTACGVCPQRVAMCL